MSLYNWLRAWKQRYFPTHKHHRQRTKQTYRPRLEVLEDRLAPSADFDFALVLGNTGYDAGRSVATDVAGNVYVTGAFEGTVDFDPGAGSVVLTSGAWGTDVFVAKYTGAGGLVWAIKLGGINPDVGTGIAVDASGNVYTTGYFERAGDFGPYWLRSGGYNPNDPNGDLDVFVCKLDSNGNVLWAGNFGGVGDDGGLSIAVDSTGNVYTTGVFRYTADFDPNLGTAYLTSFDDEDDFFVSKLDANGNYLWARSFGGDGHDDGVDIAVDGSGNVYTTGFFHATVDFDPGSGVATLTSAGSSDAFISKLDSNGNYVWAEKFSSSNAVAGYGIALDGNGNIYTTGKFKGTTSFGFNYLTATTTDVFVSKLDSNGNNLWARQFAGDIGEDDCGYDITVDSSGNVYTTGTFGYTVDFDPGPGTATLTASGYNVFVSKLGSAGNYIWASQLIAADGYGIATDGSGNVFTTGTSYSTSLDVFLLKLIQPNYNSAPTNISLSNIKVNEGAATNTMVGNLSTTDPNPGNSHSYSMINSAGGRFKIVGSQVLVDNGALLDHEASPFHTIRVRTTDQGGLWYEKDFFIIVNDVNDPPVITSNPWFNIAENAMAFLAIVCTDVDLPAQTVTFSLSGGADQNKFSITSGGVLSLITPPDYENPTDANADNVYLVQVTASDGAGGTAVQNISFAVTPANDNSPVITTSSTPSVAENNTAVLTVAATDADQPAQTITYSISGGADQGKFSITSGGVLTFNSPPDYENPTDANTDNVYQVQVTASDGYGGTYLQNLTVTVTPVNDNNPVFTCPEPNSDRICSQIKAVRNQV